MPENDQEFLQRLLATFKVEADEHIVAIISGLLDLEKTSPDGHGRIIETVFREAHSLKGAARSVNLVEIESVCQKLESLFAILKQNDVPVTPELLDRLHKSMDVLKRLVSDHESRLTSTEKSLFQDIARHSKGDSLGASKRETSTPPSPPASIGAEVGSEMRSPDDRLPVIETVRISTARLDTLLLQVEELVSAKLAATQHGRTIQAVRVALDDWKKEWSKMDSELRWYRQMVDNGKADRRTSRLIEFLNWNREFMSSVDKRFTALEKPFEHDRRALAGMVDNLLDDIKRAAMLPFSTLSDVLRKLVRDLSRQQGKLIDLVIEGADIEMDRRILEGLKDPLIHLVRNSIDHGIETPPEREQKNKPPRGKITIAATRQDSKVEILVADDGRGLDAPEIRHAAARAGMTSETAASNLSESDVHALIFQSGVSTSPNLTHISGRGLGLAIVREKVQKLDGSIAVRTAKDKGTAFSMMVPLTLSTFRGIVVCTADRFFIMPTTYVERVSRINVEEVKTVENRETILFDAQTVPLLNLAEVLGIRSAARLTETTKTVLVINSGGRRVAFAVDTVLQEQEVLLKGLGKQLVRVRNISGAAILGNGQVVPVLNVADLFKSATSDATKRPVGVASSGNAPNRSVIVADDSITTRTLIKNILETNGYQVTTAVDGIDALTKIRTGNFALVVSDVEMPRMDGFDLTEKIRGDKKWSELPVVLVTGRESPADREHGADVGANAYIVKSSFNQSNLLEAVKRLI